MRSRPISPNLVQPRRDAPRCRAKAKSTSERARPMTGAELRTHRKAARMSQSVLAQRAGIRRHAVSFWECKAEIDPRGWAVRRMAKVLRLKLPDYRASKARARAWGNTDWRAQMDARIEARLAPYLEREAQRAARQRAVCGARTRKGMSFRNISEPGKRRCKFHGGKSTGPKTVEGRGRIAEAQRKRWRKIHAH